MQSDGIADIKSLKTAFTSIPSEVNVPKDLPLADNLIISTAEILGAGPASRPVVHPRPANAGLRWDELSEDTQQKYHAVLDMIEADAQHSLLSGEMVQAALKNVRQGLLHLAKPMQQGYSGMVQRRS